MHKKDYFSMFNKKDYLSTFCTLLIVMVANFLLYKLSGLFFGAVGFSEFSLIKRIIAFLIPIFLLGTGIGLTREVARLKGTEFSVYQRLLLNAVVLIVLFVSLLFMIIISVFHSQISVIFFSSTKYSYLLYPLSVLLFGNLFSSVAYSFYRGLNKIAISNILLSVNMCFIPVLVICFADNLQNFLYITGFGMFIFSLLSIIQALFKGPLLWNRRLMSDFYSYSLPRLPGDISFQLIFLIPPVLVAHMYGLVAGGAIAFGLSLLNIVIAPLNPLSIILLPKGVEILKTKNQQLIRTFTNKLIMVALLSSSVLSVGMFLSSGIIANLFIGDGSNFVYVIKGVAIACAPFSIYIVLRSIVDAGSRRAYNSINTIISFALFCLVSITLYFYSHTLFSVVVAINISFLCLGMLTFLRVKKLVCDNSGVC